jgi:hypothetical protein
MRRTRLVALAVVAGLVPLAPSSLAADPGLVDLLRNRRLDQAFQEAVLRLAHDPTGVVAFEALTTMEPALARYPSTRFQALAKRARRTYARRARPAVDLLEAARQLVATPDGFHDPDAAHTTLRRLAARSDDPVKATLASWIQARDLATLEPGKAAGILERLVSSDGLPPRLRARARLFLGVCLTRSGSHDAAAAAYRAGLEESGGLAAPEGGTLEPFFRHGLADVLRASGRPDEARTELAAVVDAKLYPAREAAKQELTALE